MIEIQIKDWFKVGRDELNQHLPFDETITSKEGDELKNYFLENPIGEDDFMGITDWEKFREMVLQMFLDSGILNEVRCEMKEKEWVKKWTEDGSVND